MLTQIELEHFKCFEKVVLPLSRLTLLSGGNASGKSSVLQALVLLHQTTVDSEWSRELLINGSVLALGTLYDVVDKVTGRRALTIGLSTENARSTWRFEGTDRRDMSIALSELVWEERGETRIISADSAPQIRHLLPVKLKSIEAARLAERILSMSYINAERLGPRETYPLGHRARHRSVGRQGEGAVGLLYWQGDEPISSKLILEGAPPTLLRQSEARMRAFFPGASIEVLPVSNANLVTLGIRTNDATDFHRPQHVGYGLTHILPIVVAGLAATPRQLLLVENPEVHLHPAGQALMGRFLAEVAAAGVQVILETHSDHVLNGIRRAVRQNMLARDDVALHFFNTRDALDRGMSQVLSPQIDDEGNLDHWPNGFFDQFDKDMNYFAGWGD